jgi:hypothetical protein
MTRIDSASISRDGSPTGANLRTSVPPTANASDFAELLSASSVLASSPAPASMPSSTATVTSRGPASSASAVGTTRTGNAELGQAAGVRNQADLPLTAAKWLALATLSSLPLPSPDFGASSDASFIDEPTTGSSITDALWPLLVDQLLGEPWTVGAVQPPPSFATNSLADGTGTSTSSQEQGSTGWNSSRLSGDTMSSDGVSMHDAGESTTVLSDADLTPLIRRAAAAYGVPENLIRAVIQQESGGRANAVSSAGAAGLMQLMPATARALGVTDVFNPVQNVFAGTRYLAELLQQFGGDVRLALAAYNAGPNAVRQYQGIPPFTETQHYVNQVLSLAARYA